MRRALPSIEALEARIAPAGLNPLRLNSINPSTGFAITIDVLPTVELGGIANIGDTNGDGFDDLLIAVPSDADGKGTVVLVFGRANFDTTAFDLVTGAGKVYLYGEASGDFAGTYVAAAGDVNGDGLADFVISAPGHDAGGTNRGAVYVVFGRPTWDSEFLLSALNGSDGFKVVGNVNGDELGTVAGAYSKGRDFNGDGFDDVIIGAPNKGLLASGGGAAFVIFGKSTAITPYSASFSVAELNGTNGFTIASNTSNENLGRAARFIGDVNGDGFDDIAIGQFGERLETTDDSGYVIFGRPTAIASILTVEQLTAGQGFRIDDVGNKSFGSIPFLIDFNRDGDPDFTLQYIDINSKNGLGRIGFAFAKNKGDGFEGNPFENGLKKGSARVIQVPPPYSISFDVGDFNGDGYPDIVVDAVGTPNAELYFGKSIKKISTMSANKDKGISFTGLAVNDELGTSVGFIGDINGDGLDDLLILPPSCQGSQRPTSSSAPHWKSARTGAVRLISTPMGTS